MGMVPDRMGLGVLQARLPYGVLILGHLIDERRTIWPNRL